MFLNRITELARLQHWWDGGEVELITLYGRRQVGKTELLVQFLQDKQAIYFYADRQLLPDHLRAFTEQVLHYVDDPVLRLQPFTSWEAALTYVFRLAATVRLAVVIDEFSYAVDADAGLPSVLQRLWDAVRRSPSQAFVALCTSFTEAVERHFQLDGPLYAAAHATCGSPRSPIAKPRSSFRTGHAWSACWPGASWVAFHRICATCGAQTWRTLFRR